MSQLELKIPENSSLIFDNATSGVKAGDYPTTLYIHAYTALKPDNYAALVTPKKVPLNHRKALIAGLTVSIMLSLAISALNKPTMQEKGFLILFTFFVITSTMLAASFNVARAPQS